MIHTLDVLALLPDAEASVPSQWVPVVCCCVYLCAVSDAVRAKDCLLSACEVKPISALHSLFVLDNVLLVLQFEREIRKKNGFTRPIQ